MIEELKTWLCAAVLTIGVLTLQAALQDAPTETEAAQAIADDLARAQEQARADALERDLVAGVLP